MGWELIPLMVPDVTIVETAPGVAPDGLDQVRQGLQHGEEMPANSGNASFGPLGPAAALDTMDFRDVQTDK